MNLDVNFYFDKKTLKIKNFLDEKKIEFNFPIKQIVKYKNCVLVRLEPDIGIIYNENIFCVSPDGIVWQIEAIRHIDDDSPYTNIVVKNEQVFLYCWSGEKMEINPQNGKIIKKTFTK